MHLLKKKIYLAVTLLVVLIVCALAPLAQSGRSVMRGYFICNLGVMLKKAKPLSKP